MAKQETLIGAHVSGGIGSCLQAADAIGAEAIQIFGSSPRMWRTKLPSKDEAEEFKKIRAQSGVKEVYLHAAYLANLASASPDIYAFSVQSIIDHLKIAEMIGAEGLIFHLGSTKGGTREEGFAREIAAMKKILHAVPGNAKLIMENTAGGGDKIGASFEDIARLFHEVDSPRVAMCYDTAHGFEAGLVSEYTPASVKKLVDALDKAIGIKNLVAIHANDSKTKTGSNHDQHENIGEGFIGLEGFKALAGEKRLHDKAWLLEVPGFRGEGPDKENVELLRSCFQ